MKELWDNLTDTAKRVTVIVSSVSAVLALVFTWQAKDLIWFASNHALAGTQQYAEDTRLLILYDKLDHVTEGIATLEYKINKNLGTEEDAVDIARLERRKATILRELCGIDPEDPECGND